MNLKTKRLEIKNIKDEDLKKIYKKLYNNKKVCKACNLKYYNNFKTFESEMAVASAYDWIIFKNNTPIGTIQIYSADDKKGLCEISYQIHPKYQNRGYCTECLIKISEYLIEKSNYKTIIAKYKDENIPSKRVLEKSGFTYKDKYNNINIMIKGS